MVPALAGTVTANPSTTARTLVRMGSPRAAHVKGPHDVMTRKILAGPVRPPYDPRVIRSDLERGPATWEGNPRCQPSVGRQATAGMRARRAAAPSQVPGAADPRSPGVFLEWRTTPWP